MSCREKRVREQKTSYFPMCNKLKCSNRDVPILGLKNEKTLEQVP